MEAFKEYLTIKGHSKSTIQGMTQTAKCFNIWLEKENIPCGDISYADVLSFIQTFKQRGIKPKTQNTYTASIKKYLDHLTEQGVSCPEIGLHKKV